MSDTNPERMEVILQAAQQIKSNNNVSFKWDPKKPFNAVQGQQFAGVQSRWMAPCLML